MDVEYCFYHACYVEICEVSVDANNNVVSTSF